MGCLSHTVNGDRPRLAEINFIEITLEDVFLAVLELKRHGSHDFPYLSPHRALRGVKEVLRKLLGQSTPPLHHGTVRQVGPERTADGNRINADMGEESTIFDR